MLIEKIEAGEIEVPADENIRIPGEVYRSIVEACKEQYGKGFNKTYREMTTGEFYREVYAYMTELELVEKVKDDIVIRAVVGKIAGKYPEDFLKNGGTDEQ